MVEEKEINSELMIQPVKLKRIRPFVYRPTKVDDMMALDAIIPPGDYGCYFRGSLLWRMSSCSLTELLRKENTRKRICFHIKIPFDENAGGVRRD